MAKTFQVDTGGTLTTNLIAYWKMEDATEFYNAYDVTNNGVTFSGGKVNNAGDFDGVADDMQMSNQTAYNVTSDFSWSLWVKFTNFTGGPVFVSKFNALNQSFYFQMTSGSNLRIATSSNGTSQTNADFGWSPNTGQWYHLVVIYRDATDDVNVWIDGVDQGNIGAATSIFAGTSAIDFGEYNGAAGNYLTGSLDELGFWSKKLSSTEVGDLYNGGSGQTMVETVALTVRRPASTLTMMGV